MKPQNLNIVLVEPEIPQNTGTIGRTCVALGAKLHLVEPLGFELSDKQLKRAGLDYWPYLELEVHRDFASLMKTIPTQAQKIFFTKKMGKLYHQHRYEGGCYLFFGKETKGLPESLLHDYEDQTANIPMFDERVRSLNLSNAVSIAAYEVVRQLGR